MALLRVIQVVRFTFVVYNQRIIINIFEKGASYFTFARKHQFVSQFSGLFSHFILLWVPLLTSSPRSLSCPHFLLSPLSPSSFPPHLPLHQFHLPPSPTFFPLIFRSTTNLQLITEVTEVVPSLLAPLLPFLCQRPDPFHCWQTFDGPGDFPPCLSLLPLLHPLSLSSRPSSSSRWDLCGI